MFTGLLTHSKAAAERQGGLLSATGIASGLGKHGMVRFNCINAN